jgi:hypothetical protein
MTTNPDLVTKVEVVLDSVYLHLADGRVIGNPLAWHPWLMKATPEQRAEVELYELSVYFPQLDDGLDVDSMVKGIPPRLSRSLTNAMG